MVCALFRNVHNDHSFIHSFLPSPPTTTPHTKRSIELPPAAADATKEGPSSPWRWRQRGSKCSGQPVLPSVGSEAESYGGSRQRVRFPRLSCANGIGVPPEPPNSVERPYRTLAAPRVTVRMVSRRCSASLTWTRFARNEKESPYDNKGPVRASEGSRVSRNVSTTYLAY